MRMTEKDLTKVCEYGYAGNNGIYSKQVGNIDFTYYENGNFVAHDITGVEVSITGVRVADIKQYEALFMGYLQTFRGVTSANYNVNMANIVRTAVKAELNEVLGGFSVDEYKGTLDIDNDYIRVQLPANLVTDLDEFIKNFTEFYETELDIIHIEE